MSLRRFAPLFLFILLVLAIMTYQSIRGHFVPLHFLHAPLSALNSGLHTFALSLTQPFKKAFIREEELTNLRTEINRLHLEHQQYRDIFHENRRLKELLALREKEKRYVATVPVISGGLDRWSHTIIIGKGARDGISKDMAAITPRGLIGKVSEASDHHARVLLMTDVNFSAAVKIQETRLDAVISGNGSQKCFLKYIPEEETVKEGSVVVTSGFDELFPSEIPVGIVSKLSKQGEGIFQLIEVTPFEDLKKLDEVMIIRR